MKTSDAKTKFCPLQRQGNATDDSPYFCDVDKCMMWEPGLQKNENYTWQKRETEQQWINDPNNGDCGLKSKDLEVNF